MTARSKAGQDAILRSSLTLLVQGHDPEDLVRILGEVIDDHAVTHARRTGDYAGASRMITLAKHLMLTPEIDR